MVTTVAFVILVLVVIAVVLLGLLYQKVPRNSSAALESRLEAFEKAHERTERVVKEEIALSRGELGKAASEQRQELSGSFKSFGDLVGQRINDVAGLQKTQLDAFAAQLTSFARTSGEKLDGIRTEASTDAGHLREEVVAALRGITDITTKTMGELANVQKGQLEAMTSAIEKLADSNEKKLEAVRITVEGELKSMKSENAAQLEQMRQTVDE